MLGKILGGRYRIVRHLGGGGFGQTYLSEDLHLPGKPACVVKQLKPRMTNLEALQTARRLFDTEAEVLYALGNHDQIPRLFAHFADDQDFYLVQELIAGEVLSQELRSRKQFPEHEVMRLVQEILDVLEFVHQQQVVHRDIKPSNLIRRQCDHRIILIDFGAVKQISLEAHDCSDQASVTIAVGSSGYMPNEQLAGKPRFASDIYAVGMLAIQCLTGVYPKRLKEDPRTSEIIWRDRVQVNPEFADILDTMVRYDFRQRYPSAKEALDALRPLTRTTSVVSLLTEPKTISFDGHLAWLERGDELFQLQRYQEAIAAYDRVIQAKPEEYVAWFKRGIALENLKQFAAAAASYEQVITLQPADYLAWYKWAVALAAIHQYQEALRCYERVVQLQPDNYWAWHDRGTVLEAMQQLDEAVQSYGRAVQLKPDFQLAIDHRKQVLSRLSRVDTLYHLQHYDEAVASCDRAIQANPTDPIPWLMRGMALENLNCHEQAIAAYDRVVELQPDDHVAWFKRAVILEKLQRYEEAITSYYRIVQIQPDNYWAWYDRGRLLETLQRFEEALSSYDRAMQLKPDFQEASAGRRRMLGELQQRAIAPPLVPEVDTDTAAEPSEPPTSGLSDQPTSAFNVQNLQMLLMDHKHRLQGGAKGAKPPVVASAATDSDSPAPDALSVVEGEDTTIISLVMQDQDDITLVKTNIAAVVPTQSYEQWLQQGQTLQAQKRYEDALLAYAQASKLQADQPQLWQWQGDALYALGHYSAAIAAYQKALQLEPANAPVYYRLGGAHARLQQYQHAFDSFNQTIQIDARHHLAWYWRGRILCELKHYPEAIQSFDQALALKPDFHQATKDRKQLQQRLKALAMKN